MSRGSTPAELVGWRPRRPSIAGRQSWLDSQTGRAPPTVPACVPCLLKSAEPGSDLSSGSCCAGRFIIGDGSAEVGAANSVECLVCRCERLVHRPRVVRKAGLVPGELDEQA